MVAIRAVMTVEVAQNICSDTANLSKLSYNELKEAYDVLSSAGVGAAYAPMLSNIESFVKGDLQEVAKGENILSPKDDYNGVAFFANPAGLNWASGITADISGVATSFEDALKLRKNVAFENYKFQLSQGALSDYDQMMAAYVSYADPVNTPTTDEKDALDNRIKTALQDIADNKRPLDPEVFESVQGLITAYPGIQDSATPPVPLQDVFDKMVEDFDKENNLEGATPQDVAKNEILLNRMLASDKFDIFNSSNADYADVRKASKQFKVMNGDDELENFDADIQKAAELRAYKQVLGMKDFSAKTPAEQDDILKKAIKDNATSFMLESILYDTVLEKKTQDKDVAFKKLNITAADLDPANRATLMTKLEAQLGKKASKRVDRFLEGKRIRIGVGSAALCLANTADICDGYSARLKQKVGQIPAVARFNDKIKKFDEKCEAKYGKVYVIGRGLLKAIKKMPVPIAMSMVAGTGPIGMGVYAGYTLVRAALPLCKKYMEEKKANPNRSFMDSIRENKALAWKAGVGMVLSGFSAYTASSMSLGDGASEIAGQRFTRRIAQVAAGTTEYSYKLGKAVINRDAKGVRNAAIGLVASVGGFLGGQWLGGHLKSGEAQALAPTAVVAPVANEGNSEGGFWSKVKGWFSKEDKPEAQASTPVVQESVANQATVRQGITAPWQTAEETQETQKIVVSYREGAAPVNEAEKVAENTAENVASSVAISSTWSETMGISKAQFVKLQEVYGKDELGNMYANLSKEGVMENFKGLTKEQVLFKFQRLDAWTDRVNSEGISIKGVNRYHFDAEMKALNRLLNDCGGKLTVEEYAAVNKGLSTITDTGDYTGPGKTVLTNNYHIKGESDDCDKNKNTFKMGGKVAAKEEVVEEKVSTVVESKVETKVEETKVEETKVEETKVEEAKVEEEAKPTTRTVVKTVMETEMQQTGRLAAMYLTADNKPEAVIVEYANGVDSSKGYYILRKDDAGNDFRQSVNAKFIENVNPEVVPVEVAREVSETVVEVPNPTPQDLAMSVRGVDGQELQNVKQIGDATWGYDSVSKQWVTERSLPDGGREIVAGDTTTVVAKDGSSTEVSKGALGVTTTSRDVAGNVVGKPTFKLSATSIISGASNAGAKK